MSYKNYYVQYTNNGTINNFNKWKTFSTRNDMQLFSFDNSCYVLHFTNEILENETDTYQTLKYVGKDNEFLGISKFNIKTIKVIIEPLLSKYYKLLHLIIKNQTDENNLYIERYIPNENKENEYVFHIDKTIQIRGNIQESFIFGIQYRYNDTCGVSSIEFIKNPSNTDIFFMELYGKNISSPTISFPPDYTIKINNFKKKVYIMDDNGVEVANISFNKMKRNTFKTQQGNTHTSYTFDVNGGKIYKYYLNNDFSRVYFDEISIISGQMILNTKCNCKCNCNCQLVKITYGNLNIEKNININLYDDISNVNISN